MIVECSIVTVGRYDRAAGAVVRGVNSVFFLITRTEICFFLFHFEEKFARIFITVILIFYYYFYRTRVRTCVINQVINLYVYVYIYII